MLYNAKSPLGKSYTINVHQLTSVKINKRKYFQCLSKSISNSDFETQNANRDFAKDRENTHNMT